MSINHAANSFKNQVLVSIREDNWKPKIMCEKKDKLHMIKEITGAWFGQKWIKVSWAHRMVLFLSCWYKQERTRQQLKLGRYLWLNTSILDSFVLDLLLVLFDFSSYYYEILYHKLNLTDGSAYIGGPCSFHFVSNYTLHQHRKVHWVCFPQKLQTSSKLQGLLLTPS